MLTHRSTVTALPLIAAVCALPACAADIDPSGSEADESESEQVDSESAPLVRTNANRFWPNGHVVYCFDDNVPDDWRKTARDALTNMTRRTPLTFGEFECANLVFEDHLRIKRGFDDTGGESDEIGWDEGQQNITLFSAPDERLVTHEVLHAVGLYHEQTRADRDGYVIIDWRCIDDDKEHNYDKADHSFTSGIYDYESVMHYQTGAWCDSGAPSSCMVPDGRGGTVCATILKEDGSLIRRSNVMSREDINAIYYMYAKKLPSPAEGDLAGNSVAVGDFDGDGYSDVAVGLPGRAVGGVAGAGEVRVYKGTSRGLIPWQTIDQSTVGWVSRTNDRFGWTLAAANLDDDGRGTAELIIGAPFEDIDGSVVDAGAVAVLRADEFGELHAWRTYRQRSEGADVVQANARFGYSVAVGRVAQPLNAWGAPDTTWGPTLVIGAPGADSHRGAVFLYAQTNPPSGGTPQRWTQKVSGLTTYGEFGRAVAVGVLTGDSVPDLVVGSPETDALRGQVDIFRGNTPTVFTSSSAPMISHWETVAPPDAETRGFGRSLALGNFRGDGAAEIAIGAPGTRSDTGAVYVYQYDLVYGDPRAFHRKQTLWQNEVLEAGDLFGYALAAANVDRSTDQDELIVGAPWEDSQEGAISVFRGGAGTLQPLQFLQQGDIPSQATNPNSRFGFALAAGSIDGIGNSGATSDDFARFPKRHVPDVVVGSPRAGSVSLFLGDSYVGLNGFAKY